MMINRERLRSTSNSLENLAARIPVASCWPFAAAVSAAAGYVR